MSITDRPLKPQACVVEGDKVGIFIGSSYRQLNLDQARELHAMIGAAIEQVVSRNSENPTVDRGHATPPGVNHEH